MTLDEFFAGHDASRRIFDALHDAVGALGPAEMRVSKSQIAFKRRVNFAWTWMPDVYLGEGHAPLVLTLFLQRRDTSRRWKQIVEPYPGRFTHHLELHRIADVDDEIRAWLQLAWTAAQ